MNMNMKYFITIILLLIFICNRLYPRSIDKIDSVKINIIKKDYYSNYCRNDRNYNLVSIKHIKDKDTIDIFIITDLLTPLSFCPNYYYKDEDDWIFYYNNFDTMDCGNKELYNYFNDFYEYFQEDISSFYNPKAIEYIFFNDSIFNISENRAKYDSLNTEIAILYNRIKEQYYLKMDSILDLIGKDNIKKKNSDELIIIEYYPDE